MTPLATIVIPTHNHGPLLRASVRSALEQTVPVEIHIVGDGADEATRTIANQLAQDPRVIFFDNPKAPRHGEVLRDAALQTARGQFVCYLADDDLYAADHVEHMCGLLQSADFVHAFAVRVAPDSSFSAWTVDLSAHAYRRELLAGRNRVPLSAGAHTLAFYRNLPAGWTSAPPDLATDLHMWQKFLRHPECRFRSGRLPTVFVFPSPLRGRMSLAERESELNHWRERIASPAGRAALERELLAQKSAEAAAWEHFILAQGAHEMFRGRTRASFQVFFPTPSGYTERESACCELRIGHWEEISIELPEIQGPHPIRVDPADVAGLIQFEKLELRDEAGNLLWMLSPDTAGELNPVHELARVPAGPLVFVSRGIDPQLWLPPALLSGRPHRLMARLRLSTDPIEVARAFG